MAKTYEFQWDDALDAAANAKANLPSVLGAYFATVRKALAKNPAPPELHGLRLETKRLRYTLELFRPVYGPGLETRIASLRQLQQLLGEVNDSAATGALIGRTMRQSIERTRVEGYLAQLAGQQAAAFRKHWVEVFDVEGSEESWKTYLERPRKRAVKKRPRAGVKSRAG